ncbi:unnamed protein product [Closterium sp. NIES-54]
MKSAGNESESRNDRFPGQFFFVSTQASAGPEKDEGFEEPAAVGKVTLHSLDYWVIDSGATYSMTPRADLLTELEPSPVKHVTSALGQRAEVKCMGKAMFKGADGKMVGLKNVLWVPNLAENLISVRRLQKAGMDTSSKGAKTYTARLGERILWDLHEDRDVYNEMWQILVVSMPKERQVAASISTKGEVVGSGDGTNGRAKEIESKKCNLGGTSKLGDHEESGAAAKKQHKGEENPKAAADEEYGENMWGTIASAAFSNPTSATGECDWLTLHRRMGHVALPILQQLVKNEMVAGIRVKGEPDEVLGCPTCMQAKFTRYPFSGSEATAKAPVDEVVMDVVGPLKLGAAGAEYLEVKSSGLEHVELPLEMSNGSTTTQQSSLVNGGKEAKDAEEEEEEVQQQRLGLHVPAAEEEGRGKRRIQAPNWLTYDALGKPAKSALARAALIIVDDEESDYEECTFAFFSSVEMLGEPATLKEALQSCDAGEWKKAMESELKSIEENGMWELVELPEGRNAITSKWLFKIKSGADGKIERYKSMLAAKGYQQKENVDNKELFALVVKPTTLGTLLMGGAIKGWGPEEESVGEEERRRFHSLVGSLMYVAVNTQPDVAFAIGQLARVVQCPNEEQVAAGMRVAKYLGQIPTVGLQPSAAVQRCQKGSDGVEPGFVPHRILGCFLCIGTRGHDKCWRVHLLYCTVRSNQFCVVNSGGAGAGGAGAGGTVAGGAGAGGAGAGGTGTGGTGAGCAGAGGTGDAGARGTVRPRPYFVPLLQHILGVLSTTGITPPLLCRPPDQSQSPFQPASPLPPPSPYTEQFGGLKERREPASRPILPVRTARRVPHPCPSSVPGTHAMALRPSSVPLRVPLPPPPDSSLHAVPHPESDLVRTVSLTVDHLLATVVTNPSFESAAVSALIGELVDFPAAYRLDNTTALVAESESACPPSIGGECALSKNVLEDRQEDFGCLAAVVPRFASMLLAPEGDTDAPDIPTPLSGRQPWMTRWHPGSPQAPMLMQFPRLGRT